MKKYMFDRLGGQVGAYGEESAASIHSILTLTPADGLLGRGGFGSAVGRPFRADQE